MTSTFRPGLPAIVLNVTITIVLISVPIILYRLSPTPLWVCGFVAFGAAFWTVHTVKLFVAKVVFSDDGIYMRGILRRYFPWNKITRWSYLGGVNPVYFELDDGSIQGFDGWCIFGDRKTLVASLMEANLGAPSTGADAVFPPFLRSVIQAFGPEASSHPDPGDKAK